MKRKLIIWVSLLGIMLVALGCAPAASPSKALPAGQAGAVAPAPSGSPAPAPRRQEGGDTAVQSFPPSGIAPSAPDTPFLDGKPAEAGGAAGDRTAFDRMIIYNAQTSMEVKDVTDSIGSIALIAERQGGFVAGSTFRLEGERKVATIVIKVPARNFQATLAELRGLAVKVEDEGSKSQDVTEEYADLDAQVRNLEATEARYLDLLKRAVTIDEILKVQARVDETRRQIDRIKGRMGYLDRTAEMASITVSLFSKAIASSRGEPGGWWKSPAEAWEQSLVFLGRVASAIAIGVAFFWWAIILIAMAAVFTLRSMRHSLRKVER